MEWHRYLYLINSFNWTLGKSCLMKRVWIFNLAYLHQCRRQAPNANYQYYSCLCNSMDCTSVHGQVSLSFTIISIKKYISFFWHLKIQEAYLKHHFPFLGQYPSWPIILPFSHSSLTGDHLHSHYSHQINSVEKTGSFFKWL